MKIWIGKLRIKIFLVPGETGEKFEKFFVECLYSSLYNDGLAGRLEILSLGVRKVKLEQSRSRG